MSLDSKEKIHKQYQGNYPLWQEWLRKGAVVVSAPFIMVAGVISGFFLGIYSIYSWLTVKTDRNESREKLESVFKDVPIQSVGTPVKERTIAKDTLPAISSETLKHNLAYFSRFKVVGNVVPFDDVSHSYLVCSSKSTVSEEAYKQMQRVEQHLLAYQEAVHNRFFSGTKPCICRFTALVQQANDFLLSVTDAHERYATAGIINGFLRSFESNMQPPVKVVVSAEEGQGYFSLVKAEHARVVALTPENTHKIHNIPDILFQVEQKFVRDMEVITVYGKTEGVQKLDKQGKPLGEPLLIGGLFPRLEVVKNETDVCYITLGGNSMHGAGIIDFTGDVSPFHAKNDAMKVPAGGKQYSLSHADSNTGIIEGGGCNGAFVNIAEGLAKLTSEGQAHQLEKAVCMTDMYNNMFHGRARKNHVVADVLKEYSSMSQPSGPDIRQALIESVKSKAVSPEGKDITQFINSSTFKRGGYASIFHDIMSSSPMLVVRARGKLGDKDAVWNDQHPCALIDKHDRGDLRKVLYANQPSL